MQVVVRCIVYFRRKYLKGLLSIPSEGRGARRPLGQSFHESVGPPPSIKTVSPVHFCCDFSISVIVGTKRKLGLALCNSVSVSRNGASSGRRLVPMPPARKTAGLDEFLCSVKEPLGPSILTVVP